MGGFICYLLREHWKKLLALVVALLPVFSVGKAAYQFYSTVSHETVKCAPLIKRLETADRNLAVNTPGSTEELIDALNAYNRQVGPSQMAIMQSGIELIGKVQAEQIKLSVKLSSRGVLPGGQNAKLDDTPRARRLVHVRYVARRHGRSISPACSYSSATVSQSHRALQRTSSDFDLASRSRLP